MADTFTPNYNLTLVQIGASRDTWGTKLNANFTALDTDIKAVSVVANAALPAGSYTAADVLAKILTVDGAGSTLDADTVDGIQAAAFQLASGYTAADVLAKLLTVDGTGSTLDADTVDGLHAAAFMKLTSATQTITGDVILTGGLDISGALTKHSEGVYSHWADPAITSGRKFISPAAGSDPTSLPGDEWLGY